VSAIYPWICQARHRPGTGELHDLSFFVNVGSIVLAIVLLTAGFGSDFRWRSYRRTSVVLLL
jgi:hypothetical protein